MAIEVIVGAVTVRVIDPLTPPKVAKIFADPTATPVPTPALSITAIAGAEDVQVTRAVKSRLLPSL